MKTLLGTAPAVWAFLLVQEGASVSPNILGQHGNLSDSLFYGKGNPTLNTLSENAIPQAFAFSENPPESGEPAVSSLPSSRRSSVASTSSSGSTGRVVYSSPGSVDELKQRFESGAVGGGQAIGTSSPIPRPGSPREGHVAALRDQWQSQTQVTTPQRDRTGPRTGTSVSALRGRFETSSSTPAPGGVRLVRTGSFSDYGKIRQTFESSSTTTTTTSRPLSPAPARGVRDIRKQFE